MPEKACHDFNNDFTLFTAVPVLFNMYTDKDSNLISDSDVTFRANALYVVPPYLFYIASILSADLKNLKIWSV